MVDNTESILNKLSDKTKDQLNYLKKFKILYAFNLANDFVPTVRLLRQLGISADLLVKAIDPKDPVRFADPLWEDENFDREAIIYFPMSNNPWKTKFRAFLLSIGFFFNTVNPNKLARFGKKYDIIISTPPGPIYFHNHTRNVIYDAGWARDFTHRKEIRNRLATKAYQKAKKIVFTNPDMKPLFERIGAEAKFVRFAVEIDRYKPDTNENTLEWESDLFTIFCPSRQQWIVKLNNHLIIAFSRLSDNTKLILTEWGPDVNRSKQLIKELGIENRVLWVSTVNKTQLINRYNNATVVADQFGLGSYGLAAIEAMACGKATLMYINEEKARDCFGDMPPVVNCNSIDEIEEKLRWLMIKENRVKTEEISREWVITQHNPYRVLEEQIDFIHEVLVNY